MKCVFDFFRSLKNITFSRDSYVVYLLSIIVDGYVNHSRDE